MIIKRICPQTGIVNFFVAADPFMAIGSVVKAKAAAQYDWRCYFDEPIVGTTQDRGTAEAQLRGAMSSRRHQDGFLYAGG
jgi:hypothetical protein